jgi:excisionase family DNA binding protein
MTEDKEKRLKQGRSIREAAKRAGVSRSSIYRLIAQGRVKPVKVLGRTIITDDQIDALLTGAE